MHRRPFLLQTPLVAAALLSATGPGQALAAARAPGFELPGPRGPVRLADFAGHLVLLDFWASWCAPCRLSFPWMAQMQSKYRAQGLQVVAINVDARRADAEKFLATMPVQFAVAFDPAGDTPKVYGIKAMPSSFLIGTDGRLLHSHAGFRESDKADLEQRIRAALALA
jgi:thiol-disulfide isomerase/thioredoxin